MSASMWVKICGNTNLVDAQHAAACGADALGFIFARSPRQLTVAQAIAITSALPLKVERVGVFDWSNAEEILSVAEEAGLTGVQLHGAFDETLLEQIASSNLEVIQTLHWQVNSGASANPEGGAAAARLAGGLQAELRRVARISDRTAKAVRVLLDSKVGSSAAGGTGVVYNWAAAAQTFRLAESLGLPMIAAGGLRPENVSEAITQLRPGGVDVASGVEVSPGRKNPARVASFIAKAQG